MIIKKSPKLLLLAMTATMSFIFAVWSVLLNNFVIEKAAFSGAEIGILQSLREVPGFLAFTAVFILLVMREQTLAMISLLLLALGVALTGVFPTVLGLYATTILMSIGFHYYETISKSLTLQWLDKSEAAHFMGKMLSARAFASLAAYGLVFLFMTLFGVSYLWTYVLIGGVGVVICVFLWNSFPLYPEGEVQHKKIILRKRYWLYYLLTFLSGARRQIFVVFAGFMMVEKFGYSVSQISLLFIVTYVFNLFFGASIGKLIGRIGERNALNIEYLGLIFVFVSYAYVDSAYFAAGLYVVDHLFFAFAIATSTYFQKIADPKDIAATSSVSFTINHIAAVLIPVILGFVWLSSPKAVFLVGAGFALCSLLACNFIPREPAVNNETLLTQRSPIKI
jgi:predicted MFS family arabinose efflux permease